LSAGDASSQVVAIAKDLVHLADIKVLHGQDLAVAQELDGLLGIAVGQLIMECPHRTVQLIIVAAIRGARQASRLAKPAAPRLMGDVAGSQRRRSGRHRRARSSTDLSACHQQARSRDRGCD
jgi:hypothetical protein